MDLQRFQTFRDRVLDEVCSVIVGKRQVAELVLTCFVCRGHVLLEDVPGTGKTMMLRAFPRPWAAVSAASNSHRTCCLRT